ncbi:hypothetical protein GC194_08335 [bacterium]|nr:hypothetical protein [bacterium]
MKNTQIDHSLDQLILELNHPLTVQLQELRNLLKNHLPQLEENIKWNAPNYSIAGRDLLTFNLRTQSKLLLIMHRGAKKSSINLKNTFTEAEQNLMEWKGNDRVVLTFSTTETAPDWYNRHQQIIEKWITHKD